MNCHYCDDPDKHDVLPASEVTYFDSAAHSPNRGKTITTLVHKDKHPAGSHIGITCKKC